MKYLIGADFSEGDVLVLFCPPSGGQEIRELLSCTTCLHLGQETTIN